MNTLVLKLILTPALILSVTAAGRRWGSGVSGFLIGLPLTSGPVAFFFAVEQGEAFAAEAAVASLAGIIAVAAACATYGLAARRGMGWRVCITASWLAFSGSAGSLHSIRLPVATLFPAAVAALLLAAVLLRPAGCQPILPVARTLPWRDAATRAATATMLVLVLTGMASYWGARISGILSPFPVYTSVLVAFTHVQEGPAAARRLLSGQMLGSISFAVFFLTLALQLQPLGTASAFLLATAFSLLTHGLLLTGFVRRQSRGKVLAEGR